jgi:hypothetical protein
LKPFLHKLLFGYYQPQEYICVCDNIDNTFLFTEDGENITNEHIFLGYKPLIIGLKGNKKAFIRIKIEYNKRCYGCIDLARRVMIGNIGLYVGINASHRLMPRLYQIAQAIKYKLKIKPPGNISLKRNLYEQVKLAYSYPRHINIITIRRDNQHNMFPTDLHGRISDDLYYISLRQSGMACAQVEELKRVVLSKVDISFYRDAYSMGKNHMRALRGPDEFPASTSRSRLYENLLPREVLSYLEMIWESYVDIGVHRIHLFKIENEVNLNVSSSGGLAHIHSLYANWRDNQGFDTVYYLH